MSLRNMNVQKSMREMEGAWAAAGFSLVLIFIGIPIWWGTTSVYRANLPYSQINLMSSAIPFHTFHLNLITYGSSEFESYAKEILVSRDSYVKYLVTVRGPDMEEDKLLQSHLDIMELVQKLSEKNYIAGSLSIYFLPKNYPFQLSKSFYLTRKRFIITQQDTSLVYLGDIIHDILRERSTEISFTSSVSLPSRTSENSLVKRQVSIEPTYDIVITLMLPQPHLLKGVWDARQAVKEYLDPLVTQIKGIADLRVKSQVLYMTNMKISPKWSSKYKHHSLPEQQLPLTINDMEAKLGSFVSTRPSLHFIVYVPNDRQVPLQIHRKDGTPVSSNSFLVPRWGSVMIYNPPSELLVNKENHSLPVVFDIDSRLVMSNIVYQLHKLFPIPPLVERSDTEFVGDFHLNLLTDWQYDGLARSRVLSYLSDIRITLQSLCGLVGEISNMVVSDEVGGWVWAAVGDWSACLDATTEGRLKEATQYCKNAFTFSDSAFFHPSMLALLYFPDNQKYAIYVPLFLPVCIPVVLSLRTILKLFKKQKSKEE